MFATSKWLIILFSTYLGPAVSLKQKCLSNNTTSWLNSLAWSEAWFVSAYMKRGERRKVWRHKKIKIVILWDWLGYSERITTRDELNDPSGRHFYRSRSARTKYLRPPCPFFSPEENDFFQIYIQINLKLYNSTTAVKDFIHATSWFRGKL